MTSSARRTVARLVRLAPLPAAAALLVVLALPSTGGALTAGAPVHGALISVAGHGVAEHDSTSDNWSGYDKGFLEHDTTFDAIGAEWTVPTATQHTPGQAESSATWIGIGGGCLDTSCTETDNTLIQAGTEQDVAADGTASYSAWWEIVPVPSVSSSITVDPGDLISCSITQSLPEVWDITLKDLTDGQSFTETVPYASSYLTAEWIEETPLEIGTSGTGISALPDLSTTHFSDATVNGAGADLVPAEAVQLVDSSGTPLATPSAPDAAGTGFDDCSYASACAAPTS
ncbi:MAG TPA: G1 family glutamic endopeptidase [Acidimicrobiales bacterium]|nr:G1 family glutamic endopeptidase [Acidimicrobiales bacterium]